MAENACCITRPPARSLGTHTRHVQARVVGEEPAKRASLRWRALTSWVAPVSRQAVAGRQVLCLSVPVEKCSETLQKWWIFVNYRCI